MDTKNGVIRIPVDQLLDILTQLITNTVFIQINIMIETKGDNKIATIVVWE